MQLSNFYLALSLTVMAGLSSIIGAFIVFIFKGKSYKNLSFFLSLAAGVMISVSFIKIFYESVNSFMENYEQKISMLLTVYSFFFGILICYFLDKLISDDYIDQTKLKKYAMYDNKSKRIDRDKINDKSIEKGNNVKKDSNIKNTVDIKVGNAHNKNANCLIYRAGFISFIAMVLHNIPEGVATFVSAMTNFKLAIPIAIAIAIHNVPEGIAVATPIYYSTNSKWVAFKYTFFLAMSEPLGALLGFIFLGKFMNDIIFGTIFGIVSGIMVYISFNNLLPLAYAFTNNKKVVLYGIIMGVAIMLTSVVMFG